LNCCLYRYAVKGAAGGAGQGVSNGSRWQVAPIICLWCYLCFVLIMMYAAY